MGAAVGHDSGFAGRADEQELLASALEGAASGKPCALVVEGEAGIGKTSLVRDACSQGEHDFQVLWGTCVNFGAASVPFAPIIGALRTWLTRADPVRAEARSTADEFTQLVSALGGAEPTDPGRLLARIDQAVNRLAQLAPVVLVVDDLQWADCTSLDVLAYLITGFQDQRLALLMTCRDEHRGEGHPLHGWLADMRRMPRFAEVRLDRLSVDDTEEQLKELLGGPVDIGYATDVYERSGGNPYLTELLVRHRADSELRLPANAPTALRDALLATWHGLSTGSRQITRVLAVGGRPLGLATLAAVGVDRDIDPDRVPEYLVEAEEHGVVRRDNQGRLWFRHPLLAEVLYNALPPGEAARIHASFVRVLESQADTSPDQAASDLAVHNHRSGRVDEAYRWSLVAAARASELRATTVESLHLERACSLWDQLSPEVRGSRLDHIDLLRRTSESCGTAGRYTAGLGFASRAMELVDRASEPLLASEMLLASQDFTHPQSGMKAVNEDLIEALRLTDDYPDSAERSFALEALAFAESFDSLSDAAAGRSALAHVEEALRTARLCGNDVALAAAHSTRAFTYLTTGAGDPIPDAMEAERIGRRCGDPTRVGVAVTWHLNALGTVGRRAEAAQLAEQAMEELHALGSAWEHFVAQQAADVFLMVGRWRECREVLRRALAARCDGIVGASVRLASATLAVRTGRLADARLHLDRALEMVSENYAGLRDDLSSVPAEIMLAEGDAQGALDWLVGRDAEILGTDDQGELVAVARAAAAAARAARDAGDEAAAARAVAVLDDLVRKLPAAPFTTSRLSPAGKARVTALFEAEVARAHDDDGQAELWRIAAERCEAVGAPWQEAIARLRCAEAMIADGSPGFTVKDELRRAHLIAVELGAVPLKDEIESLARVARVDLRRPVELPEVPSRSDALAGLTPREREVLAHLVAGRSNGEIAKELVVSVKTVSVHVSNILRKTGTSSRTEAAVLAQRLAAREPDCT
ncbi:AAA family ATPase [Kribbella sp. NPDC049227]|uniref:helix-turn-helix transcriptional regulator n=1 Tax=Kribbella sp. NPDC049227 TaxID=3364113 RepID=UPI003716F53E